MNENHEQNYKALSNEVLTHVKYKSWKELYIAWIQSIGHYYSKVYQDLFLVS